MKKLFVLLLLVSLSLLSVGAVAMAEETNAPAATNSDVAPAGSSNANLYLDYSRVNETNFSGIYSNSITIGMDYNEDFLAGAYYSAGSNYGKIYSGDVPPGYSQNTYMAYFGYNVLSQKDASLGIIASYWDIIPKSDAANLEFSSLGIGIKGSVNFGSGNISLLYSYGVSNSLKTSSTTYTDKTYISLVELKGVYYFSDTVGMHAVYRWTPITSGYLDPVNYNYSSFGLGVDFKF